MGVQGGVLLDPKTVRTERHWLLNLPKLVYRYTGAEIKAYRERSISHTVFFLNTFFFNFYASFIF